MEQLRKAAVVLSTEADTLRQNLSQQGDELKKAKWQLEDAQKTLRKVKTLAENPDSFWMPECVGCTSATDKACLLCACAYISGLCEERNMYG